MTADRNRPGRRPSTARVRLAAEPLEARQLLAVITVNSAGDADGADGGSTLSLRQAIEVSNGTLAISSLSTSQATLVVGALGARNTIDFAITGTGPFVIEPATALPAITKPVVIDGYSQAGAHPNTNGPGQAKNTVIAIEIDGAKVPAADGLDIQASGSIVRGLAIGGFATGDGILLDETTYNTGVLIQGNFIGTDASGTVALPNGNGIADTNMVAGLSTIGGTADGAGNVLSGNTGDGLVLTGSAMFPPQTTPVSDLVQGNFIGTDVTGTRALPDDAGIVDNGGGLTTIGGSASGAGNLISGNSGTGLDIGNFPSVFERQGQNYQSSDDLVQGNLIGTDVTGTKALANRGTGITDDGGKSTIGGTAAGDGNVVSGNTGDGLTVAGVPTIGVVGPSSTTAYDLIEGNFIGTDASGTSSLPNGGNGILFTNASGNSTIGGFAAGAANVIAFNKGSGVAIKPAGISSILPTFQISQNSIDANGAQGIVGSFATIPTLLSVTPSGTGSLITGAIVDNPIEPVLPYTIEFFANTTPDPSGSGQGQTYLGSISVTTNSVAYASFSFSTPINLLGKYVSATAIGINFGTSDFSNDVLGYTASTSTTLTGPGVAQFGAAFALTATVAPAANGIPTGQVTFLNDGTPIGTSTLNASGIATLNTAILEPGSYTIQADYLGDGTNSPSRSATIGLTILGAATTTILTGPTGTTPPGQPVTLTATVPEGESGFPSGDVQFSADGVVLGTASLQPLGIATFVTSSLGTGGHVITAAYLGDLFNAPSQSSPITVTVGEAATSTTLAGLSSLALLGKPITLTVLVQSTEGIPSGTVAFAQNGRLLGTATLNASGVATFTTTSLALGSHAVTAAYLGDASFTPSLGGTVIVGVLASLSHAGPAVTSVAPTNPDTVTIGFRLPLMVGSAQNLANYAIVGPDGKAVAIESAEFDPIDDSVTLTTEHALKAGSKYRITVEGSRSGGVADVAGVRLAGKHGRPGTNYTGTFKTARAPHAPKKPARAKAEKASAAHKSQH